MLSVSLILELVAAMLFGIVLPGHHKEVDSLNSPTLGLIPERTRQMGITSRVFKCA